MPGLGVVNSPAPVTRLDTWTGGGLPGYGGGPWLAPLRPQWRARTSIRRRHRTWGDLHGPGHGGLDHVVVGARASPLGARLRARLGPWFTESLVAARPSGCCSDCSRFARGTIWVLLAGVTIIANLSLLLIPALLHEEVTRALAP